MHVHSIADSITTANLYVQSRILGGALSGTFKRNFFVAVSASLQLRNSGNNILEVTLIHSSEAVDLLRRVTSSKVSPGLNFYGVFRGASLQEETKCNTWLLSMEDADEEELNKNYCNFTNKQYGHPWFCEKPKSLACSTIKQYKVIRTNEMATLLERSELFEKGVNFRVQIGEKAEIFVSVPEYHIEFNKDPLPPCASGQADSVPPDPAGQFVKGRWQSFHCNALNFTSEAKKTACLANKVIYFLGDSTIRQWYAYFVTRPVTSVFRRIVHIFDRNRIHASEIVTVSDIWEPREAIDTNHDVTLRFSAHGPPLQNGGSPYSQPYIADRIDAIKGGKNVVVAFTVGTHLLLYNPAIYVQRLKAIKKAVWRLLKRYPDTRVLFKGFNIYEMDDFTSNQCCISDWLAYRYDRIARNMFKDTKNVVFLDMWDLSASHDTLPAGLHTHSDVVENEIALFLSFACPNIKA